MTNEQIQFHMDAFKFLCEQIRDRSATQWDFAAIRRELDKLETQRGIAYPTS
jgi:hypothetical protein